LLTVKPVLARVAVFLASDDSAWLTGERLAASGGYRWRAADLASGWSSRCGERLHDPDGRARARQIELAASSVPQVP